MSADEGCDIGTFAAGWEYLTRTFTSEPELAKRIDVGLSAPCSRLTSLLKRG